jgi:hypothetical protein
LLKKSPLLCSREKVYWPAMISETFKIGDLRRPLDAEDDTSEEKTESLNVHSGYLLPKAQVYKRQSEPIAFEL